MNENQLTIITKGIRIFLLYLSILDGFGCNSHGDVVVTKVTTLNLSPPNTTQQLNICLSNKKKLSQLVKFMLFKLII